MAAPLITWRCRSGTSKPALSRPAWTKTRGGAGRACGVSSGIEIPAAVPDSRIRAPASRARDRNRSAAAIPGTKTCTLRRGSPAAFSSFRNSPGSVSEGVRGPGRQIPSAGSCGRSRFQFPQFDRSGRGRRFQPVAQRLDPDQQRLGWSSGPRREFPGPEPRVHHARRLGFGRVPEPVGFVHDHLGALEVVIEPALESGRTRKTKSRMGPFPEIGADPFPRRWGNHRFGSRKLVAPALRFNLELPDALDSPRSRTRREPEDPGPPGRSRRCRRGGRSLPARSPDLHSGNRPP